MRPGSEPAPGHARRAESPRDICLVWQARYRGQKSFANRHWPGRRPLAAAFGLARPVRAREQGDATRRGCRGGRHGQTRPATGQREPLLVAPGPAAGGRRWRLLRRRAGFWRRPCPKARYCPWLSAQARVSAASGPAVSPPSPLVRVGRGEPAQTASWLALANSAIPTLLKRLNAAIGLEGLDLMLVACASAPIGTPGFSVPAGGQQSLKAELSRTPAQPGECSGVSPSPSRCAPSSHRAMPGKAKTASR
jgi:hypothetical protein